MASDKTATPSSIARLLAARLLALLRPEARHPEKIASLNDSLERGCRSLFLRHLDCGSCNGCELELKALANPIYDSERLGIKFEASPRHADVLVLTGVFTQNLAEAAELTLAAMSQPRLVITVGDCAVDGGIFRQSYSIAPRPPVLDAAVVQHVAGCPPTPADILRALDASTWSDPHARCTQLAAE